MSSHREVTIVSARLSKGYTLASALIAATARIAISTNLAILRSISISSFPLRAQTVQTFLLKPPYMTYTIIISLVAILSMLTKEDLK
jgi:hypothetical protein